MVVVVGRQLMALKKALIEYVKQAGEDKAHKLWNMSLETIDIIDERIENMAFNATGKGYATLALNERRMDDLIEMEKESHKNFGYQNMQLWDKTKLKQHLGRIFIGAIDSNSGICIHLIIV